MKKAILKSKNLGLHQDVSATWLYNAMFEKSVGGGKPTTAFYRSGTLSDANGLTIEGFVNELLLTHVERVVYNKLPSTRKGEENWLFYGKGMAIDLDYNYGNRACTISMVGEDVDAVKQLQAVCFDRIVRKVTQGRVYIVVSASSGPYLHEMGAAGEDFEPGNYRAEVAKEYAHVVADLNSLDPCGRIVLLDGPPGTGKTHLVRALLNAVPKATFVLVPSNMVSELGSPSFVKVLLDEQKPGHPVVLVIEDADEAIASRKSDNVSQISALLNFSDGIYGAMLDIRLICTTNVDAEDLDAAVMRPGRLCRRIEVAKLDAVQAEAVYKRLGGPGEAPYKAGNFYILGQVYQDARGSGGNLAQGTKSVAKGRLGFAPSVQEDKAVLDDINSLLKKLKAEEPKIAAAIDADEEPTLAEELGMKPGEYGITDDGTVYQVMKNGQFRDVSGLDDDGMIDEDPLDADED